MNDRIEGLDAINETNKAVLIAKGCSEEMISDAIAGAQFSRPRQSMIYSTMSSDDIEDEA